DLPTDRPRKPSEERSETATSPAHGDDLTHTGILTGVTCHPTLAQFLEHLFKFGPSGLAVHCFIRELGIPLGMIREEVLL
ncbi:hypothetical protein GW17_00051214, partial [Ensete ventricosum]